MNKGKKMKETPYTNNQRQNRSLIVHYSTPLERILTVILLCALCGIGIKECKRADLRLKRDKYKYERFMDSINNIQTQTSTFVFNNQKIKKR